MFEKMEIENLKIEISSLQSTISFLFQKGVKP